MVLADLLTALFKLVWAWWLPLFLGAAGLHNYPWHF